jgi:hypothetical protein
MPTQDSLRIGWLLEYDSFLACPLLSCTITTLVSNVGGHLLLKGLEHVFVLALDTRAKGKLWPLEVFAGPLL